MIPAAEQAARLAGIRRLAPLLAGLLLAVVGISAWLRLHAAGLGCADWPACYGRILDGAVVHPGFARVLHRITASAALLLALALAWRALRPRPLAGVAAPAVALVAVMLLLSLAGVASADPGRVVINLLNLVGGLALVALCGRLVWNTPQPAMPRAVDRLAAAGLALLAATVLLGALIGARYAASACLTLPDCHGVWWPAADAGLALDALARPAGAPVAGEPLDAALHLLHRYGAVLATLVLGIAAARRLRIPAARRTATAVLALLLLEASLGVLTVASGYALWLAVAHNVGAAILLAVAAPMRER